MLLYSIEFKRKMKNITKDEGYKENQEYKEDQEYKANQAYKEDEEREENSDVTLYRSK